MINLNKKDPVADAVKDVLQQEALKGNQDKIDANGNNRIDSGDFEILRAKKKAQEKKSKVQKEESDRTEDCLDGKPKAKKGDDVGPGADGKSSKVKLKSEQITLKGLKEKFEEPILDELINEVLSKDASAGDWIHDFVHSDNPKFAGKSKAKRKEMALAAYYKKQEEEVKLDEVINAKDIVKHVANKSFKALTGGSDKDHLDRLKKDMYGKKTRPSVYKQSTISPGETVLTKDDVELDGVEQIDELSKGTLKSYLTKKKSEFMKGKTQPGTKEYNKDVQSMGKAHDKINKEEVEQIDELSKSTLGSYVKKAARDMSASRKIATDFEHREKRSKKPSMKAAASSLSDKFNRYARKRNTGIGQAVERLTKEETVEEGWDDMVKSAKDAVKSGPKPSGGSGVKQGSRYGGGKQKDKPEHDDDKVKSEAKRPDTDTVPFVTDEAKPMTHAKYLAKKSMKRMRKEMLGKISN